MLPEISFGHFLLPILPIPRRHINAAHIVLQKASVIDVVTVWIAPRYRQGRDATRSTDYMNPESVDLLWQGSGVRRQCLKRRKVTISKEMEEQVGKDNYTYVLQFSCQTHMSPTLLRRREIGAQTFR